MSKPPNIVVVSDLHVGSMAALCPAEFDTELESHVRDFIRQSWASFCAEAIRRGPFVLVVNGDATEGIHHGGRELLIKSQVKQWRAAAAVLTPMLKHATATYITEGTECHTLDDEADLAEELKAVPGPEGFSHRRLKLRVNGFVHSFTHHIGTSARPWTETTALMAALISEREQARLAGEAPTDILVCAHRHTGGMIRTDSGICATSASWQFPTRHVRKVVSHARPVVGGIIIEHAAPGVWPTLSHLHYRPAPMEVYDHA